MIACILTLEFSGAFEGEITAGATVVVIPIVPVGTATVCNESAQMICHKREDISLLKNITCPEVVRMKKIRTLFSAARLFITAGWPVKMDGKPF